MFKFYAFALLSYAAADFRFIGEGTLGPKNDECIDIKAPCKTGEERAGCTRKEGEELEKGINIQTWKCHGEKNQEFEFANGRIRNPVTNLCLDIKADCKDGSDTPKCDRESVEDIKKKDSANLQLWTCREDTAEGFKSKSYGNQKFDFKLDGTLRNELTGFCVTAHEGKTATDGTNVEMHQCTDEEVAKHMQWEYCKSGKCIPQAPARLYSDVGSIPVSKSSMPMAAAAAAAMCVAGVAAVVAVVRSQRPALAIPLAVE